jgi:hypothetical protein
MTEQAATSDRELTTAKLAETGEPVAERRSQEEPARDEPLRADAPAAKNGDDTDRTAPLLASDEAQGFRSRWGEIQAGFVDEPRRAVEEADGLVANAMKRLAEMFAAERDKLEGQWDRGDDVSTEDLRQALRRYRAFFDRLLSV